MICARRQRVVQTLRAHARARIRRRKAECSRATRDAEMAAAILLML
jgi:hypothetical protein